MNLERTTAPAAEPLQVDEVRNNLKEPPTTDNPLIEALITAAREYAETFTRRALMTQTWKLRLDGQFPFVIEIPNPPLQSITSIEYVDTAGVTQTLAATEYQVDTTSTKGRIKETYSKSWPSVRDQMNSITVTFVCGYGDETLVPIVIKQAMHLLIAHWYENRQAMTLSNMREMPLGVKSLLWSQRVIDL